MNRSERGSALIYILIAIALLAALTVTFMEPSSQQTTSQNTFKSAADLKSQADFIQTAIQECVLYYGDKSDPVSLSEGFQKNAPFPLLPSSEYFDNHGADTPDITTNEVKYIRCPGNNTNNWDHARIFSGSSGKFIPPQPDLFGEWMYYAGEDGVFIWIKTNKTDAFLQSALEKLDEQYAECEADIITAAAGVTKDMDSEAVNIAECAGGATGATCFRVWFKMRGNSQKFPDEPGCP